MKPDKKPKIEYLIFFDDANKKTEFFTNKTSASKRFKIVESDWYCHIFKRVISS